MAPGDSKCLKFSFYNKNIDALKKKETFNGLLVIVYAGKW